MLGRQVSPFEFVLVERSEGNAQARRSWEYKALALRQIPTTFDVGAPLSEISADLAVFRGTASEFGERWSAETLPAEQRVCWACQSMWLIVVLLVVGIYLWKRSHETKKREHSDLRRFSHRQWVTKHSALDWDIDLVEMRLSVTNYSEEPEPTDNLTPIQYSVRRKDGATWQCKITEPSREAEIARLRSAPKSLLTSINESRANELEGLLATPLWGDIAGEITGPLESQYQRFVVHYRAP